METFQQLGLKAELINKLQAQFIHHPTSIQERAIPIILEKRDVLAKAKTGTGKTFAFLLPILQMVNESNLAPQALIVTPTRELAIQITKELNRIKQDNVNTLAVYGGQDMNKERNRLKEGVHILVATPGRLLDHMRRETMDLSNLHTFVLDEADQLLHLGFLPDIENLIDYLPMKKQTLLFSATIPMEIRRLAKRMMDNPKEIFVQDKDITLSNIKQFVYETTDREKQNLLCELIQQFHPFLAIIFCRTKRRAKTLNSALLNRGFLSDELHGDLSQGKREKVMERFRTAKIQLLVATDVAARGLDVEGVTHVFNYDIPHDVDSYIHRIGRTGRAGYEGFAITLVAQKDKNYLHLIEKGINLTLKRKTLPKRNK